MRYKFALAGLAVFASGCSTGPDIAGPAQNTPYEHASHRVFYLGDPQSHGLSEATVKWAHDSAREDYRRLLGDAELVDRLRREHQALVKLEAAERKATSESPWWARALGSTIVGARFQPHLDPEAIGIAPTTMRKIAAFAAQIPLPAPSYRDIKLAYERELVQHGDPLAVLVSGVRIPESPPSTFGLTRSKRDVAVILEVESSTEIGKHALVVAYQRDVPPGQMLNFADILVYFDPAWDSTNPVQFRLQVLDVKAERNLRTRELLEKSSQVLSSIQGLVPHPAIPGIDVAIQAASLVVSNKNNEVLLDYRVQFHSRALLEGSNHADVGLLRRGSWLVLGRPTGSHAKFWAQSMYKHRRTDEILTGPLGRDSTQNGHRLAVPYFELTVSTADAQVPKSVLDRSEQLLKLISTTGKDDPDALSLSMRALQSSVEGYAAERRLKKFRDLKDLGAMIQLLFTAQPGQSAASLLGTDQQRGLFRTVRLVLGEDVFSSAIAGAPSPGDKHELDPRLAALKKWWGETGATGELVSDPSAPLGFRWTAQ